MRSRVTAWFAPEAPLGGFYTGVWALMLAIALVGIIGVGVGPATRPAGYALLAVGGGALALLALAIEIRLALARDTGGALPLAVVAASALAFTATVAVAAEILPWLGPIPLAVRLMLLATGFQALLLTVDVRAGRRNRRTQVTTLVVSHGAIFAGSWFTLSLGPTVPRAGLLLYAGGFAVLLLTAFWTRTATDQTVAPGTARARRRWEALLLAAITVGIVAATAMALTTSTSTLTLRTPQRQALATLTGAAAIVALAMLGAPRRAPAVLRWVDGPTATVTQHVVTLLVIANGLLLGVFIAAPWLLAPVFAGFMLLLLVSVGLNYGMLLYGWRYGRAHGAAGDADAAAAPAATLATADVTVVITAVNEYDALASSLRENVAALAPLPFLVVLAARSTDGTRELIETVRAAHPDRVRVVDATGGSKAADLNAAWAAIDTPYVLVLDADETVTPAFVDQALATLAARPAVGIVQGRKVAATPDAGRLARFISAERQHSTWLDHPFDAAVLGAAHFAGSAAVLRREVLPAVDGFATDMLTEDIDLSVRLYLTTEWDIAYVPSMVARELIPGSWPSLFGQRERWARGWAQVAGRHLGAITRSRRRLGLRRTVGLSWVLFLAISAPVFTLLPALALPALALDAPLGLSLPLAVALAVLLIPERAVSFAYATLRDPAIPWRATPRRLAAAVAFGYLWLAVGWLVQFHALYLQLAGAPRTWRPTRKVPSVREPVAAAVEP